MHRSILRSLNSLRGKGRSAQAPDRPGIDAASVPVPNVGQPIDQTRSLQAQAHRRRIDATSSSRVEMQIRFDDASMLARLPPAVHAQRLLDWLQSNEWPGEQVLFWDEVAAGYLEMCADQYIEPKAWKSVANPFAKLVQEPGRPLKTYMIRTPHDGGPRTRARYYRIPRRD